MIANFSKFLISLFPIIQLADNIPIECFICRGTGHVSKECTLNIAASGHSISLSAGFDKAASFRQSNDQMMKDDAKTSFKHNAGTIDENILK